MSTWRKYAKRASRDDIVVTYFGFTKDGLHSFDVHRVNALIGIIKRGTTGGYVAWRNGHDQHCDTLFQARDWIVARQAESP